MKVSRSKTEYMCVNEREGSGTVRLQGEEVKKVQEFKYLGSTVQSNGEYGKEVKKRVQAGWNGWRKVSGVLCERKICDRRIKGKVYRTVVRPAMLYGLETVSLRKRQESELEVAELKMLRSSSVSCNTDPKNRMALRLSARKTPPIPGGRLNPITGLKDSGPAYQHLQEAEGSERNGEQARVIESEYGLEALESVEIEAVLGEELEMMEMKFSVKVGFRLQVEFRLEVEPFRGGLAELVWNMMKPDGTLHRDIFQSSQHSQPWAPPRNLCSVSPGKRSLGPYRIPIIQSVHSHQDETSCMQTTSVDGMHQSLPPQGGIGGRANNPGASPPCDKVGEKWKEGIHVPEESREKLKANTNVKQDDIVFSNPHMAKETVCILLVNGAGHGGTAPSGPTETQLVYPRDIHKDFTQPRQ
ncbi:hypothetical protein QTP70_006763 [Hemibagrus guttatus]|uniref:Uncharacterized protein n=1 Tax=Hemibagrus guttatus TaxID=175788 RepID=A0AAE0RG88_9TELE|nr:hypothetical protein QTP70_006763 [Hemibagrus guttatus]